MHPKLFFTINGINTEENDNNLKTAIQNTRFFVAVWTLGTLIFSLAEFISLYDMNQNISAPYKNGSYNTVDGYVEDFEQAHKQEIFTINGIEFSYSDSAVMPGYHNERSRGGVIRGNGQHLKIKYITYKNKNYIMYIEEIKQ